MCQGKRWVITGKPTLMAVRRRSGVWDEMRLDRKSRG